MKQLLGIFATIFAFVVSTQAQDFDPPTLTITAPVGGVALFTDRATVTGDATATATDATIKRVQYRIEGSRRWRNAILTNPDSATTAYVFSFKNTKKGRARRVYVRAIDSEKGESDIIGRKIYRSRANRAPVTTTTETETETETDTATGASTTTGSSTGFSAASYRYDSNSASMEWALRETASSVAWLENLTNASRAARIFGTR